VVQNETSWAFTFGIRGKDFRRRLYWNDSWGLRGTCEKEAGGSGRRESPAFASRDASPVVGSVSLGHGFAIY
jgi:hypothetical protein